MNLSFNFMHVCFTQCLRFVNVQNVMEAAKNRDIRMTISQKTTVSNFELDLYLSLFIDFAVFIIGIIL